MDDTGTLEGCKDTHLTLEKDLDGWFIWEVKMLRNIMPENCKCLNALKYILNNNLSQGFLNMIIALKILLTSLITVALVEWSFSDKILIKKNYLRLRSVENKIAKKFKLWWQFVNLLPKEPEKFCTIIFKYVFQNCFLSSQFLASTVVLLLYLMWFNITFSSFSSLLLCLFSGPAQRSALAPQMLMLGLLLGPVFGP